MVNNNNTIPIEVKKPFETVYELKETNWWEKYEIKKSNLSKSAQDLVNKKSGSDYVSKNKDDYGPCSEGGCSYSDAECQCYINQFYVPLYLACPAPKYQPPYYCSDTTKGQWRHKDCRGRMFINDDLNIKCMKCKDNGSVENWTFACASHPGKYEWASKDEFKSALGYLNNLWKNNYAGRKLIEKMIDNVIEHKFRYS